MKKKILLALFCTFFLLFLTTSSYSAEKNPTSILVKDINQQEVLQPKDQNMTVPSLELLAMVFDALGPLIFSFDNNFMNSTVLGPMGLYVLPRFNELVRALVDPIQEYYVGRALTDLPAPQIAEELNTRGDYYTVIDDRAAFEFGGFHATGATNVPLGSVRTALMMGKLPDGTDLTGKRLITMCA
ncbi:MAG: hypothetical protein SVN78_05995 [Deferribacterota bacterium]|nr:hypothetical protein [Deferribacterota bacterium]